MEWFDGGSNSWRAPVERESDRFPPFNRLNPDQSWRVEHHMPPETKLEKVERNVLEGEDHVASQKSIVAGQRALATARGNPEHFSKFSRNLWRDTKRVWRA